MSFSELPVSIQKLQQGEKAEKTRMKLRTHRYVREFLAEMLGTFALVMFGDGAIAQVLLGNKVMNAID